MIELIKHTKRKLKSFQSLAHLKLNSGVTLSWVSENVDLKLELINHTKSKFKSLQSLAHLNLDSARSIFLLLENDDPIAELT